MRTLAFALAALSAVTTSIGGVHAVQSAETMRLNQTQATADARNISRQRDPDVRASSCYVFLSLSINAGHARAVGYSLAAMRRARAAYYRGLSARLGAEGAAQLTASSGNPLQSALPGARDAASRWCVRHAPARRGPRR